MNKRERQQKILSLIQARPIGTQADLKQYLERAGVRELIDAIACGSDVKHGKPHPDLLQAALRKLKLRKNHVCVYAGDTPYDAAAARATGIAPIGMLSGHFPALDLLSAGCVATFRDPRALHQAFVEARTDAEVYAEAS